MTVMGQAWDNINLFLNIHVFLAFLSVMISKNNCLFSAIVHKTSVLGFSPWKGTPMRLTGDITNHKTLIYNTL